MKFGKSLSAHIEATLPGWRDKFLSYKDLKKRLNIIAAGAGDRPPNRTTVGKETAALMMDNEDGFLQILEAELEKFNDFFDGKVEDYVIKLRELQDRVGRVFGRHSSQRELMKMQKEIVDFYGELVLLENYSALNYTGVVKILKKYDKRTGALTRLLFIEKVLQQPFFTTDLLYELVEECEAMLGRFPRNWPSASAGEDVDVQADQEPFAPNSSSSPELEEIEFIESLYMRSTIAALQALEEIRSRSSTVSIFSLPPLHDNRPEER